jgi:hypothetical protein
LAVMHLCEARRLEEGWAMIAGLITSVAARRPEMVGRRGSRVQAPGETVRFLTSTQCAVQEG